MAVTVGGITDFYGGSVKQIKQTDDRLDNKRLARAVSIEEIHMRAGQKEEVLSQVVDLLREDIKRITPSCHACESATMKCTTSSNVRTASVEHYFLASCRESAPNASPGMTCRKRIVTSFDSSSVDASFYLSKPHVADVMHTIRESMVVKPKRPDEPQTEADVW